MGFIDWFNGLVGDATGALRGVISLAAIVGILIVGVKTRWAVASLVVTGVAAALVVWLASFGGLELIAGMFQQQAAG